MEILAPAGSVEQALAALDSGCNALYGGLKMWSARNRALNFTFDEYNFIISECHRTNRKFYLTLNTLLKSTEIVDIIDLLKSNKIHKPDAIIATDIGLITELRHKFPEIPIHISTQFGAYSITDIQFIESIGAQRVVFARELKINELSSLCRNTQLETEVFVYGSQCISFSGQCFWGGLVNGGSGNRGRCIGMCRDIFQYKEKIGQFMYPQDLKAFSAICLLESIGIDSAKIEGRMRKAPEICNAINDCFEGVDDYCGYLKKSFSYSGMINEINPRTFSKPVSHNLLSKNDLIIDNGHFAFFEGKNNDDSCSLFVKSIFTKPIIQQKPNIAIALKFSGEVLSGIDYINCFGERKLYSSFEEKPQQKFTIKELYNIFDSQIKANIYEFSCELPSSSKVSVNLKFVKESIEQINRSLSDIGMCNIKINFSSQNIVFQTESAKKALSAINDKRISTIIFDITSIEDFFYLREKTSSPKIIYKLPIIDFNNNNHAILNKLNGCNVMLTRVSQLTFIGDYCFNKVVADYTVNCWNKFSIEFLKSFGVKGIVLNPELSANDNMELFKGSGMELFVIKYGKLNLGYTRACFKDSGICICDKKSFSLYNISKQYNITVKCCTDFDYRRIEFDLPFVFEGDIPNAMNIFIEEIPNLDSVEKYYSCYSRSVK